MTGAQAKPRLQDVAERAGVSLATASRSLSHSPGVSEARAQQIRDIAQSMGYVANEHARSLAGGLSRTVGLVVHDIGDPYFTEIASGVLSVGERESMTVQVCHTGRDPKRELSQIRTLVAQRVGVIIIAGSGFVDHERQSETKAELHRYRSAGGRVAVIGRHHLGADAVLPDNVAAGRLIAEHLLALGHRRLVAASGAQSLTTVADRLAGVQQALADHGLTPRDLPVIEADFNRAGGKTAAQRILAEHGEATAVMALNDDMAIGVLSTLRANQRMVPDEISVTGFDDVAVAQELSPSLTTVRLPMAEMGEQALLLALEAPSARARRRQVHPELIVRDSTAPPAAE